jgi:tetratricopeptide (TPR) repeat protein
MANGQYIPAAADLNVALRYDPTMAAAYVARGDCYRSLGALDQAVADATQALQIDPQSADAFSNRAYARLRQGKLDEAIADAERAVSIDPKNARGYMTRGLALDRKPNERARDRVIADIAKAFELDPSLKELAVLKGVRQRLGL